MQADWYQQLGLDGSLKPEVWFLLMVLLPGLPVPTSPLLLLAGVIWRQQPLQGCAVCLLASALNMSWTYALAAGPGRTLLEKWSVRLGRPLPVPSAISPGQALLLLRMMPGVPFFLQNYLLGYLRVPFWTYLGGSLACNGLMACGLVLSGAGVASGQWKPVATGIGLLVAAAVAITIARKTIRRSRNQTGINS